MHDRGPRSFVTKIFHVNVCSLIAQQTMCQDKIIFYPLLCEKKKNLKLQIKEKMIFLTVLSTISSYLVILLAEWNLFI